MKSILKVLGLFLMTVVLANEFAVVIGTVTIDLKSFDQAYRQSLADYKEFNNSDEGLTPEEIIKMKYTIVDIMIDNIMIQQYAISHNIDISGDEIRARIQSLKSGFPTEKEFWEAIHLQGLNYDKLARNMKDQLLKERIVSLIYPEFEKISSEDVLLYLKRNRLFVIPVQYDVSIMVTVNQDYLNELRVSDNLMVTWDLLAIDSIYSQESILISDKEVDSDYIEAIISLDINECSEVIEYNSEQYCVIRLNKIINSPAFDLESTTKLIKDSLIEERKSQLLRDWLLDRREQVEIIYNREIFPTRSIFEEDNQEDDDNGIEFQHIKEGRDPSVPLGHLP